MVNSLDLRPLHVYQYFFNIYKSDNIHHLYIVLLYRVCKYNHLYIKEFIDRNSKACDYIDKDTSYFKNVKK